MKPNGTGDVTTGRTDFWWDQFPGNTGNCWRNNTGPDGTQLSVTSTPPQPLLPSNCGLSIGTVGRSRSPSFSTAWPTSIRHLDVSVVHHAEQAVANRRTPGERVVALACCGALLAGCGDDGGRGRQAWSSVRVANCTDWEHGNVQQKHATGREEFAGGARYRSVGPVVDATAAVQWPYLLRDCARPELGPLLLATSHRRQRSINGLTAWGRYRLRKQFDQVIEGLLAAVARRRAVADASAPPDLLDSLLADDSGALSDLDIAQTLAICLDSAMMTTGSAVCWTLLAYADCDAATRSALREGVAAEDFVREVLRHTPVMEMLNRTAATGVNLGGHPVAPGSTVLMDIAGLHHDPQLWAAGPGAVLPRAVEDRPSARPGGVPALRCGSEILPGLTDCDGDPHALVQTLAEGYSVRSAGPWRCRRDNLNWPHPFRIEITLHG